MNKKLSILAIAFCLVALVIVPVYAIDTEGSAIGQPAKGWHYLKNVSGTPIYNGDVVYFATATTVNYGNDVRIYSAASQALVAGIVMDDEIADETTGRIQVRGYHPAVKVYTVNHPIAVGEILYAQGGPALVGSKVTTQSTVAQFISLETEVCSTDPNNYAHDTNATPPTVKAILNLR